MGLFGTKSNSGAAQSAAARTLRHSSGWARLSKHMKVDTSLRVLDIGPTSAGNINFITGLGHSIYMANLAEDATRPEYLVQSDAGPSYDVDRFLREHLDFAGRTFDVIALWDTADYLPAAIVQPVIDRLHAVLEPGGLLLAFYHSKATGDEAEFARYHLTDTDQVQIQRVGGLPILQTFTNRQVEQAFAKYAGYKFFLAKDTIREVVVTR